MNLLKHFHQEPRWRQRERSKGQHIQFNTPESVLSAADNSLHLLQQGILSCKQHQIASTCFSLPWPRVTISLSDIFGELALSYPGRGSGARFLSFEMLKCFQWQFLHAKQVKHVVYISGNWYEVSTQESKVEAFLAGLAVMHVHGQCSESERAQVTKLCDAHKKSQRKLRQWFSSRALWSRTQLLIQICATDLLCHEHVPPGVAGGVCFTAKHRYGRLLATSVKWEKPMRIFHYRQAKFSAPQTPGRTAYSLSVLRQIQFFCLSATLAGIVEVREARTIHRNCNSIREKTATLSTNDTQREDRKPEVWIASNHSFPSTAVSFHLGSKIILLIRPLKDTLALVCRSTIWSSSSIEQQTAMDGPWLLIWLKCFDDIGH